MRIDNVEVYGLKQSLKAGGYPMMGNISDGHMEDTLNDSDIKRGKRLGHAKSGSGHDCVFKGIVVQYDLTCNHVMLPQFMRYHFHDIISSQSKMHRIMDMNLLECCDEYVNPKIIDIVNGEIEHYNHMKRQGYNSAEELQTQYERIMSNLPMGLKLTMRVTSNYLQLKSIYEQRKTHKMKFWRDYCDWVKTLPMFEKLILSK